MTALVDAVEASIASGGDADDVLRSVVLLLAAEPGVAWAGVAFVEGASLTLGPSAGTPDEAERQRVSVRYAGDVVAELWVDGAADRGTLETVSELIAEMCLVAWDTGGEPWDPAA